MINIETDWGSVDRTSRNHVLRFSGHSSSEVPVYSWISNPWVERNRLRLHMSWNPNYARVSDCEYDIRLSNYKTWAKLWKQTEYVSKLLGCHDNRFSNFCFCYFLYNKSMHVFTSEHLNTVRAEPSFHNQNSEALDTCWIASLSYPFPSRGRRFLSKICTY
jgi:hypothetical protein